MFAGKRSDLQRAMMAESADENPPILQEIPPRSMSTESIEQLSAGLIHRRRSRRLRFGFGRNKWPGMVLRLFVCCVVPSEHLLGIEKQGNRDNKDGSPLDLELEAENGVKNQQDLSNEDSICTDQKKLDILLGNYETTDTEINDPIKKPLFIDTSDNTSVSHSMTDSLEPSVHSVSQISNISSELT